MQMSSLIPPLPRARPRQGHEGVLTSPSLRGPFWKEHKAQSPPPLRPHGSVTLQPRKRLFFSLPFFFSFYFFNNSLT